jgi:hypothetical protein
MLRDVNTEVLINLNITAHQFIIAILLMSKQYDHLKKYLEASKSYDTFPDDLKQLSNKSLVTYTESNEYNFKSIVVQPEFIRTLWKDNMFEEIYSIFPIKTTRPDGNVQYLRRDKRLCKDLYSILTKDDRVKHEHIINHLKFEIDYREKTNSMKWMKTLQNWLSGREWENFEDLVADGSSISKIPINTYGTKLL